MELQRRTRTLPNAGHHQDQQLAFKSRRSFRLSEHADSRPVPVGLRRNGHGHGQSVYHRATLNVLRRIDLVAEFAHGLELLKQVEEF